MGLRKKKSLLDQASEYVDAAKPHVEAAYESARDFVQDTAVPALLDAKDKAAPALADARDKAAPVLADARAKAAPLIASGTALAATKATAVKDLADAKVAALKGEPEPQKGSKLKKIALFTAVAGGVAVLAKKLQGGKPADNWQSSYVPTPPPSPATPPATPPLATVPAAEAGAEGAGGAQDVAGSAPGEAIADAVETPHPVTTPDDPATVVDLDPPVDPKP